MPRFIQNLFLRFLITGRLINITIFLLMTW